MYDWTINAKGLAYRSIPKGRQINSIEENRQRRIEEEIAAKTTFKLVAGKYIAKMEKEASLLPAPKRAHWFLDLLGLVAERPVATPSVHGAVEQ